MAWLMKEKEYQAKLERIEQERRDLKALSDKLQKDLNSVGSTKDADSK